VRRSTRVMAVGSKCMIRPKNTAPGSNNDWMISLTPAA
jgi:hypothetical protein